MSPLSNFCPAYGAYTPPPVTRSTILCYSRAVLLAGMRFLAHVTSTVYQVRKNTDTLEPLDKLLDFIERYIIIKLIISKTKNLIKIR